ncbi:N-acetylmuramoyl-L-alanine amidase [Geomesophilobacter sediminis]|uniref:N-acetylmuramoyl-L-alanine amidase n=1 Tax=Geomesophilobacter sediminis TaxID=2798584 RepID=A0A8J7IX97_9BACT|nr:N-acetylmuramoyl-L-alanine amidase [Geomesophilobacter sediminis]MBJ6724442.1 N-acetylmuramoyl-L-alanine amidase [Geomesophilobacter sediminis]
MRIRNHRLCNDDDSPVRYVPSPNISGSLQAKYLVMHFTAGASAQESIEWLTSKKAKASAHVVIGRDGSVTQLVPFNRIAWHAGESFWGGLQGLNSYSIGIELDNAGRLVRKGDGWRAWFGTTYPDSEVLQAVHKHETELCGWEDYTPEQIQSALTVASLLVSTYQLLDVVGHEDIAPHRKCDPGPAFPMANFRARVMGRADNVAQAYRTTTELNIRSGPGAQNAALPGSPLPQGTAVNFLKAEGGWWLVDVQDRDLDGWVNSRYLQRV